MMDIQDKMDLLYGSPTQEIVTGEETIHLLETNDSPKHYIGLEISGFLHLGSLISTGFKINDMLKAGIQCTVFLADWHTFINDKLGGDWDIISKVARYYREAFEVVCPGVNIVLGTDLYDRKREYWSDFVRFTKHLSLARTRRAITIMGRTDSDRLDLAKLLYPPMQATDIHMLDLDIVHAGMDQRRIHMVVRDIFPKMHWKVPVAVHHKLLPGLSAPTVEGIPGKMSKSDPNSGIFIHDTDEEIASKVSRTWCPQGHIQNNPLLEILQNIIFHERGDITLCRPKKFGGDITYYNFNDVRDDFAAKKIHPADLKKAVSHHLTEILGPIRDRIPLDDQLYNDIQRTVS